MNLSELKIPLSREMDLISTPVLQDPSPLDTNDSKNWTSRTRSFEEFSVAKDIWRFGSPLLLAIGTVGNLLSILVLTRKRLRRLTTMFYLAVLAVADLAVLYTGLVRLWLDNVFKVYIRLESDFACKMHTFMVYFTLDFSVWILVAVTVDRCVCVSAPFAAKRWCTVSHARFVVLVIAVVLFLINMHYFWTVSVIYEGSLTIAGNDRYSCYTSESPDRAFFVEKVWPWIDFGVVCLVPFVIMLFCNCLIIRQIVMSARKLLAHSEIDVTAGGGHKQVSRKRAWSVERDEVLVQRDTGHGTSPCYRRDSSRRGSGGSVDLQSTWPPSPGRAPTETANNPHGMTLGRFLRAGMNNGSVFPASNASPNHWHKTEQPAGTHTDCQATQHTEKADTSGRSPLSYRRRNILSRSHGNTGSGPKSDIDFPLPLGSPNQHIHVVSESGSGDCEPGVVLDTITEETEAKHNQRLAGKIETAESEPVGLDTMQEEPDTLQSQRKVGEMGKAGDCESVVLDTITEETESENNQKVVGKMDETGDREPGFVLDKTKAKPETEHSKRVGDTVGMAGDAKCPKQLEEQFEQYGAEGHRAGDLQQQQQQFRQHEQEELQNTDEDNSGEKVRQKYHHRRTQSPPPRQQQRYADKDKTDRDVHQQHHDHYHHTQQPPQPQQQQQRRGSTVTLEPLPRSPSPSPPNSPQRHPQPPISSQPPPRPPPLQRQASRRPRNVSESRANRHCGIPSLTVMLLTVNTLFWLLTAPVVVFVIGYAYWAKGATAQKYAQLALGWSIVNMLQYTNNAVHFFLYCLTGPRFREELAAMCGRSPQRVARVHSSFH